MQAYRFEATVSEDGSLKLEALPFAADKRMEVVVMTAPSMDMDPPPELRGRVIYYDRPTDPVYDDGLEPDSKW